MKSQKLPVDEEGILLVDKPAGISSFGVVARVRRQLSEEAGMIEVKGKDGVVRQKRKKVKVGHTGTLDPFATGLLILLVGKATKRANEFLKKDKEYVATIRLGEVSTTGDLEGDKSSIVDSALSTDALLALRTLSTSRSATPVSAHNPTIENLSDAGEVTYRAVPTMEEVEGVVYSFVGKIRQRVPNFSAVKINGQRAYKLAREGKQVEMPVREVMIYEIEILDYKWPELTIRCKVSSGTYVRTLGEDIGKALGVGGYLTSLRRTKIDHYDVGDAVKIEA